MLMSSGCLALLVPTCMVIPGSQYSKFSPLIFSLSKLKIVVVTEKGQGAGGGVGTAVILLICQR